MKLSLNIRTLIVFIISLSISSIIHAQETYTFDYQIEYDVSYSNDSLYYAKGITKNPDRRPKIIYLTNSKDNSYYLKVVKKNEFVVQLFFRNNEKFYTYDVMGKENFNVADVIEMNCDISQRYRKFWNSYNNPEYYDLKNIPDTVSNDYNFKRYDFSIVKHKLDRMQSRERYIVDTSGVNHLPLLTSRTQYSLWKESQKLPNKIFLEKHSINEKGEIWRTARLSSIKSRILKISFKNSCLKKRRF